MSYHIAEYNYGDHIAVDRLFYVHHGIYIDNSVIHLTKAEGIHISSVTDFTKGASIRVIHHKNCKPEETVSRAYEIMSNYNTKYNLIFFNCESFVLAALGKLPISKQVINGLELFYKIFISKV